MMRDRDEKWALFWCRLLHPVIFGEIEDAEIGRYLRKVCNQETLFPDGTRKKPVLKTLRRKLAAYRSGGLDALARKPRSDRGKPRAVSDDLVRKAVEIKKDQPLRSDDTVNQILKDLTGKTISRSTLYRHLKRHGATRMKLGVVRKKVRKRWSRDHTHDLWVGDYMEGVYVVEDGEAVATHLCLWIDCHSRYVIEGRYYRRQTFDILIDSLLRAWAAHGRSLALYVDNAKVYHANRLQAACYSLGINLIHSTPRDPAPRGVVERIFRTIQDQFEAEIRAGTMVCLDRLNKAFSAYLAVRYHQRIHSEIRKTPEEMYQSGLVAVRHVDMADAIRYFLEEKGRTVDKDYADIRLDHRFYRVDPALRGDRVLVKYDPYGSRQTVWIYDHEGKYLSEGVLYHRERGARTFIPPTAGKLRHDYIALLLEQHRKQLDAKARGIDYQKIMAQNIWPFQALAKTLARLMGRKGGLTAFTAEELEILKKAHRRMPKLHEAMLIKAWESAEPKAILYVLAELQNLYLYHKER